MYICYVMVCCRTYNIIAGKDSKRMCFMFHPCYIFPLGSIRIYVSVFESLKNIILSVNEFNYEMKLFAFKIHR